MTRSFDQITRDFDALSAKDFDRMNPEANGIQRLHSLTDELITLNVPSESAELLLRFMSSSFEGIDPRFDLGTPGPLVHTLERLQNYREHLVPSLKRQPTPLTVWMVNRILNETTDQPNRPKEAAQQYVAAAKPRAPVMYTCNGLRARLTAER